MLHFLYFAHICVQPSIQLELRSNWTILHFIQFTYNIHSNHSFPQPLPCHSSHAGIVESINFKNTIDEKKRCNPGFCRIVRPSSSLLVQFACYHDLPGSSTCRIKSFLAGFFLGFIHTKTDCFSTPRVSADRCDPTAFFFVAESSLHSAKYASKPPSKTHKTSAASPTVSFRWELISFSPSCDAPHILTSLCVNSA